jgi:hypothetical protein
LWKWRDSGHFINLFLGSRSDRSAFVRALIWRQSQDCS